MNVKKKKMPVTNQNREKCNLTKQIIQLQYISCYFVGGQKRG